MIVYTWVIIGGVHSELHAVVLVCMWVLALLNHGAVSVLCLACGDEALSCQRRVLISSNGYTMEGTRVGFQLVAVECSFTVPVLIQKHPL